MSTQCTHAVQHLIAGSATRALSDRPASPALTVTVRGPSRHLQKDQVSASQPQSSQVSNHQADGSLIPDISSPRHLQFHLLNVSKYIPAPAFQELMAAESKAAAGARGSSKQADVQTQWPTDSPWPEDHRDLFLFGTSGATCAWQSSVRARCRIFLCRCPAAVPAWPATTAEALPSPS